jgi:acyl carrier protein
MEIQELTRRVLECANKVAGTSLSMPPDGDIPLEAFQLDSLSLFAFMVELESSCGLDFDDALSNYEQLRSVRSTAEFIKSRPGTQSSLEPSK